jgi:uncharacterized protein YndB with AHSA1/START domain
MALQQPPEQKYHAYTQPAQKRLAKTWEALPKSSQIQTWAISNTPTYRFHIENDDGYSCCWV